MTKILFIGCGNIGYALYSRMISSKIASLENVCIIKNNVDERIKGKVYYDISEIPSTYQPDVIIIAIKPKLFKQILPAYAKFKNCVFISLAAGISIKSLKLLLPQGDHIRCMPNTPVSTGEGVCIFFSPHRKKYTSFIQETFAIFGLVKWVETEHQFNVAMSISGCGPAYIFAFIEALSQQAHRLGLPMEENLPLIVQTFQGAVTLLKSSNVEPKILREQITSEGGTTMEALRVFLDPLQGLHPLAYQALKQAIDKCNGMENDTIV